MTDSPTEVNTWDCVADSDARVPRVNGDSYRGFVLEELCTVYPKRLTAKRIMEKLNVIAGPQDRLYTHSQVVGYLITLARKRRAVWAPGGLWSAAPDWFGPILEEIEGPAPTSVVTESSKP